MSTGEDEQLLTHLSAEFREPGRRAVEYLRTAEGLLAGDLYASPRLPETLAYCLREAMTALLEAAPTVARPGLWRDLSRAAVNAKTKYDSARAGTPGQDAAEALENLFNAVDRIAEFHETEERGQQQVVAILVNWTGSEPLAGVDIPRQYTKLLKRVNNRLHSDLDADGAVKLHAEVMSILRRAFTPGDLRFEQLEELARLADPQTPDVERVRSLLVTPEHLRRFCLAMTGPRWLSALGPSGVLDPPAESLWAAGAAVDALATSHPAEVAAWLTDLYARCDGVEPVWHIARAALDIGVHGRPLILQATRDHGDRSDIRMIAHRSVEDTPDDDPHIDELARVLLAREDETHWLTQAVTKLMGGLNADNAAGRLQLVADAVNNADPQRLTWQRFGFDRGGSVANHNLDDPMDRRDVHVAAVVGVIARAQPMLGHDQVLGVVSQLPSELADRLRPLVLNAAYAAEQIGVEVLFDELVAAVGSREPSGDDLPLVTAVLTAGPPLDLQRFTDAFPPAPTIAEISAALRNHSLGAEWIRTYHWLGLLPSDTHGPWADPYAVLCADVGTPGPERLRDRRRVVTGWGRSPFTSEDLAALEPVDAAEKVARWRPDPNEFMVGAIELARAYQAVATADPARFFAEPFQVATRLREPLYIEHYLRAAKEVVEADRVVPVGDLLKVVDLVVAEPWAPSDLSGRDRDIECSWSSARYAVIELLGAIAVKGLGFDGRDDDVFALLRDATLDRTSDSFLTSPDDALSKAINRPCTTALGSLIGFMSHELKANDAIRSEAFGVLDRVLHYEGADGEQHRAVIAFRLGWFADRLGDWLASNAELLFGADAPDGLGQATVDLTLHWSQTNRLLLERFPAEVRDAVARGVDNALDHALVGNLWGVDGYEAEQLVAFFAGQPDLLSRAGEMLGRLARHATEPDALEVAVAFWRAALPAGPQASLAGFGWMSMVKALGDELWADLTRQTQQRNGGVLDWVNGVCDRASAMTPSVTTIGIFDDLVRYSQRGWDRDHAGREAAAHLAAADALAATPEYQRLRAALQERGYL